MDRHDVYVAIYDHLAMSGRLRPYNAGYSCKFAYKKGNVYAIEAHFGTMGTIEAKLFCRNPVSRRRYQETHRFSREEYGTDILSVLGPNATMEDLLPYKNRILGKKD